MTQYVVGASLPALARQSPRLSQQRPGGHALMREGGHCAAASTCLRPGVVARFVFTTGLFDGTLCISVTWQWIGEYFYRRLTLSVIFWSQR